MLKEIHEQPAVMRRIIQEYQDDQGALKIDPEIVKDVKKLTAFTSLQRVQVITQV